MGLWLAVFFALAFAVTNGVHDAANSIATLVATRGAQPAADGRPAAVFNLLGALLVGTAVANTAAGIIAGIRCSRRLEWCDPHPQFPNVQARTHARRSPSFF